MQRDFHFYTKTSIDTLDYSGDGLNTGSKLVVAASGDKKRILGENCPLFENLPEDFTFPRLVLPGIIAFSVTSFESYDLEKRRIKRMASYLELYHEELLMIVILPLNR